MQKVTLFICSLLFIAVSFTNCKKKSTPVVEQPSTYQPDTQGSEWNYTTTGTSSGSSVNSSYKITATSKDSSTGVRTYRVFTNSSGPNEYYNKTGSDYFRINYFPGFNQLIELLHLKDNLTAGSTWQESKTINTNISGFGTVAVTVVLTFTVAETGINHTVNGTVFNNVIKINSTMTVNALGSSIPVDPSTLIQYYYAKNVGMINNKVVIKIPLASTDINTETKLTSYTIK